MKIHTGDIVRRGSRLYVAGNEFDTAGRRRFWRMGEIRTAFYFQPGGMRTTGYNIHTRGLLTDAYNYRLQT